GAAPGPGAHWGRQPKRKGGVLGVCLARRPLAQRISHDIASKSDPVAAVAGVPDTPAAIRSAARMKRHDARVGHVARTTLVLNPYRRPRKDDAVRRGGRSAVESLIVCVAGKRADRRRVRGEEQSLGRQQTIEYPATV